MDGLFSNFRFGKANDKNGWIYYTSTEECKTNSHKNLGLEPDKSFADCAKYDSHVRGSCGGNGAIDKAQGLSCNI